MSPLALSGIELHHFTCPNLSLECHHWHLTCFSISTHLFFSLYLNVLLFAYLSPITLLSVSYPFPIPLLSLSYPFLVPLLSHSCPSPIPLLSLTYPSPILLLSLSYPSPITLLSLSYSSSIPLLSLSCALLLHSFCFLPQSLILCSPYHTITIYQHNVTIL